MSLTPRIGESVWLAEKNLCVEKNPFQARLAEKPLKVKRASCLRHVLHTLMYLLYKSVSAYGERDWMACNFLLIDLCHLVMCSPKPSWEWLISTWNPDCLIVWILWWSKYHIHTDCKCGVNYLCILYQRLHQPCDQNTLWGYIEVGLVLPVVSYLLWLCAIEGMPNNSSHLLLLHHYIRW